VALEVGWVVGHRLGQQDACVDVTFPAEAAKQDGLVGVSIDADLSQFP
jgi:hypothetical protein